MQPALRGSIRKVSASLFSAMRVKHGMRSVRVYSDVKTPRCLHAGHQLASDDSTILVRGVNLFLAMLFAVGGGGVGHDAEPHIHGCRLLWPRACTHKQINRKINRAREEFRNLEGIRENDPIATKHEQGNPAHFQMLRSQDEGEPSSQVKIHLQKCSACFGIGLGERIQGFGYHQMYIFLCVSAFWELGACQPSLKQQALSKQQQHRQYQSYRGACSPVPHSPRVAGMSDVRS